jgi:hypothetical protein
MYKIYTSQITGAKSVFVVETQSWTDVNNLEYLAWLAEGNTAEEWDNS